MFISMIIAQVYLRLATIKCHSKMCNGLYAQLHHFLNLSQLLVSCLLLLAKLINAGVPDLSSHGNNNQTHLN